MDTGGDTLGRVNNQTHLGDKTRQEVGNRHKGRKGETSASREDCYIEKTTVKATALALKMRKHCPERFP